MATETSASDHASATDELIVKKEKDEAIAQMIASLANEDGEGKHDKPDDAQGQATPSSNTEGGEKKTGIEEVKSNDSPSLETPAEDNVKHEEVEEAQSASVPSSNTDGEAEAEAEAKADDKDEPDGIVEKSGDPVTLLEANVAGYSKEQISEAQSISAAEPEETPSIEPVLTETPQQLEKESTETEEEKQANTVDVPEASTETIEQSSDAVTAEANAQKAEHEAEVVVKEAEVSEPSPEKKEKPEPEPVATELLVNAEETERESEEKPQDVEQPSIVAVPESSADVKEVQRDAIEEKTRGVSLEELKEINKNEAGSAETEKTEAAGVEENPKEPENQPLEQKEKEHPNTGATPEPSAETIDNPAEEKTREPELAVETLKETKDNESGPTETEKSEETEPELEPETKTVVPEIVAESAEKQGHVIEVHPPIESDSEVVKESGNSESEVLPEKAEEPERATEEEPKEQIDVSEKVEETSKDVETKKEIVNETNTKIEGASDDTIKEPIPLKEEETSITENTPQVSLNVEAQASPENVVEPSHEVVEEDESEKESSVTDVIEKAPKEVVEVVKIPEQGSVPTNVEQKIVVAENDEKKEPEALAAPDEFSFSGNAEVEINKVEEQKETTIDTKVDEISAAVKEPVRETLASKFEQQEEEPAKSEVEDKKESDATKTSRDFPKEASAKPAQKQSNNIISKVKQSLVKAKKAIIGKSPSSKNHSLDDKGDIKVN